MKLAHFFEVFSCFGSVEDYFRCAVHFSDCLDFVACVVGGTRVLVVSDDVDVRITEDFRFDYLSNFVGVFGSVVCVCVSVLVWHI